MKQFILFLVLTPIINLQAGILYPKPSATRDVRSLNGIWRFSIINNDTTTDYDTLTGRADDTDLFLMPVPSSYNDILTTFQGRDHVGSVKYERIISIPLTWQSNRIWLRFGSGRYAAEVYINDNLVVTHEVGHLPFEAEITSLIEERIYDYNLTVIVSNVLTNETIPQGSVSILSNGREDQVGFFDFFNYAGIDRNVHLYRTTFNTRIEDITIKTSLKETDGIVDYLIKINGDDTVTYNITVLDKEKNSVVSSTKSTDTLTVPNPKLWWPYLMDDNPGYLYTLRVELLLNGDNNNILIDRYDQPFGIRELYWDNTSYTINGKPLYLRGFGRHEDSDIRGKGFDLPLIIRDHNLIKWIGANAYRTSHYPYAEEIMDLADELGIMIIDEVPSVSEQMYLADHLMENHKKAIEEMYQRDKNRPSVVMWSLANEPVTSDNASENYFREIVSYMKSMESTRPVVLVINNIPDTSYAGQFPDILCINNYAAWYSNSGDLNFIADDLFNYTLSWHQMHDKPVMIMEYGADTYSGLHTLPDYIWSEEYQLDLMSKHFQVFDQQREAGWFIGEFIWNFADFSTDQGQHRVGGNKKGIFTRERQPKSSAHLLRERYWALAELLDHAVTPDDVERYVINDEGTKPTPDTTESDKSTNDGISETTHFPESTTEGKAHYITFNYGLLLISVLFYIA